MYLFNALDKSNLGNAKTAGLEKDLGMSGTNQYNTILSSESHWRYASILGEMNASVLDEIEHQS